MRRPDRASARPAARRPAGPLAGGAEDGHTGLGLALDKAIVEGYGGSASPATRPTGRVGFTVRLPCP